MRMCHGAAVQFFLLTPYAAFEAVHKLLTGEQPERSWRGAGCCANC